MRTYIEFRSSGFPAYPGEEAEINPGRFGKRLAEFLALRLPAHAFHVKGVGLEAWGVRVDLDNRDYPLWIGCGNYEEFENGFLCFIEPSTPFVYKWFRKSSTVPTIERLATAIETVLQSSGKVSNMRWWAENEVPR
jgi:hypothetical protein